MEMLNAQHNGQQVSQEVWVDARPPHHHHQTHLRPSPSKRFKTDPTLVSGEVWIDGPPGQPLPPSAPVTPQPGPPHTTTTLHNKPSTLEDAGRAQPTKVHPVYDSRLELDELDISSICYQESDLETTMNMSAECSDLEQTVINVSEQSCLNVSAESMMNLTSESMMNLTSESMNTSQESMNISIEPSMNVSDGSFTSQEELTIVMPEFERLSPEGRESLSPHDLNPQGPQRVAPPPAASRVHIGAPSRAHIRAPTRAPLQPLSCVPLCAPSRSSYSRAHHGRASPKVASCVPRRAPSRVVRRADRLRAAGDKGAMSRGPCATLGDQDMTLMDTTRGVVSCVNTNQVIKSLIKERVWGLFSHKKKHDV